MLVKNTSGIRPEKRPVPPRTFKLLSPKTSQEKPRRGENRLSCLVKVVPTVVMFSKVSMRTPRLSMRFGVTLQLSSRYQALALMSNLPPSARSRR